MSNDALEQTCLSLFTFQLNLVAFAFQPHVYVDEGCAEDECQYYYKCDAGKISR